MFIGKRDLNRLLDLTVDGQGINSGCLMYTAKLVRSNMNILIDVLSPRGAPSLFPCLFVDRSTVCTMIDWWTTVIESGYLSSYVR